MLRCGHAAAEYNAIPSFQFNGQMSASLLRALMAILLLLSPAVASAPSAWAQGLRVVARVNDDAITDFDLKQRIQFAIKTTGLQDTPELRQRMETQVLRQMIDERLQIQSAKRLGVPATDAEVQQRLSEIERGAGMSPGQFRLFLQGIGVPYENVAQQFEAQIAWGKIVRRRVRPQVNVSPSEIDDAMARLQANQGKTESRVAEIFIPIDRTETAAEAKRSADRILGQLRRGAPFAAVAQQFSEGTSAQTGGDLGWILPGSLDPVLDAALEKLPLRQYSEPIRSPAGWHILYLVDRRQFAATRADDIRLNLVQMTLSLPVNASAEETERATAEAQKAIAGVRQCSDLHAQARQFKGATSGDLEGIRIGDLAANRQMYEEIPRLKVGGVAGPFRVAEGLQIVALCSRAGGDGLPTRDAISQQILIQKMEAASRRYMRDLRRTATIDIKP
jgi:peptidyl-prolyl cis-trans isomerase SurA